VKPKEDEVWSDVASLGRSFLWLTAGEAQEFWAELDATVKKYRADRDAENHPEETRRLLYLTAFVPTVDEQS
jgi:hypothetical protein